jgi:hypothetical protein
MVYMSCVCVYVICMCVCVCVHILQTCQQTRIHRFTHTYIHTYIHVRTGTKYNKPWMELSPNDRTLYIHTHTYIHVRTGTKYDKPWMELSPNDRTLYRSKYFKDISLGRVTVCNNISNILVSCNGMY